MQAQRSTIETTAKAGSGGSKERQIMTYQIRNRNLYLIRERFRTEANAIKRVLKEIRTDEAPVFITEDNGEITALVYCGVVYRPEAQQ